MEILRFVAVLALAGAISGCDFSYEPAPFEYTEENVAVYSVLAAGSDTARVAITRFQPETGAFEPVYGARVTLIHGADTLRLEVGGDCFRPNAPHSPERPLPSCYSAVVPGGIRSGERYELRVALPGGRAGPEIRGETVVPERPHILAPERGARIKVHCAPDEANDDCVADRDDGARDPVLIVSVRWQAPPGAAGIGVALAFGTPFADGAARDHARCTAGRGEVVRLVPATRGSTEFRIYRIECRDLDDHTDIAWDSIAGRVVVVAYDSAYVRYAEAVLERRAVRRGYGLEGALGVFAGAAPRGREITLIRSEE